MSRPWTAEIEVSSKLAAALIDAQFAQLAPAGVELLGIGWDNTAFLVNGEYVFRFPRRQIAVALLETETRLLPFVAPRLPLAAPLPEFVGEPEQRYPRPFAGYRKLAGRTACSAALTVDHRELLAAEPLGAAFSRLCTRSTATKLLGSALGPTRSAGSMRQSVLRG